MGSGRSDAPVAVGEVVVWDEAAIGRRRCRRDERIRDAKQCFAPAAATPEPNRGFQFLRAMQYRDIFTGSQY